MITISEVTISDFGPIESFHYKFPAVAAGTYAIRGRNGAGKSHLVGALQAAVTNNIMSDKPRGSLVRNYGRGGEIAKIEVVCDVNGEPFTVSRTVSTKRGEDILAKLAMGGYPDATTKHKAEYGAQKCNKAAEVEELVASVFGLVNPVQVSSVFVLQNAAGAMLKGTQSERAAAFQFLCGADVLAETNRYAEKRVKQFPVSDESEAISLAEMEFEKLRDQKDKALEQLAACGEKIDNDHIRSLHDAISEITNARKVADKQTKTAAEIERNIGRARELKAAIDQVLADVKALGIDPALSKDMAGAVNQWKEVERCFVAWNNAEFAIQQMRQGAVPKPLEELEKALDSFRKRDHEIAARQKELGDSLKKFGKDGKCPVCASDGKCPHCGHVFNEIQVAATKWQQELTELGEERSVLVGRINKGNTVVANARQYWHELALRENNRDRAKAEIDKLVASGVIKDWGDITETVIPRLRAYEDQQRAYEPLVVKEKGLRREMDQVLATIEALRRNQEAIPEVDVTPAREKAIREELDTASNIASTRGRLEGMVNGLETQLGGAEARLKSLRDKQAAAVKTKRVSDYLQGMRAATNPGAIPKDRAVAYIERLNKFLGFYCRELQMPFNLSIDAEYQEMMVHIDDYLLPARHRLSEGQKTMAAWVWHLSLYAMHGSRVGFIVLDEPTTGLDAENRQRVADAIQNLTKFCRDTGLQLLLVTHDMDLASVFGAVIEV